MHVKPRSYLTTGIAALSVGAIALTPVQPIPSQIALAPQQVVSDLAVELAATVNPIAAWVDTIKTTTANSATLLKFYLAEPFPLARTLVANQITYVKELLSGNANLIFPQIKNNIQTLLKAPLDPGPTTVLTNNNGGQVSEATVPLAGAGTSGNLSGACAKPAGAGECISPVELNLTALQLAAGLAFEADPSDPLSGWGIWQAIVKFAPVWRLTESFGSGLLVGALGPVLSPLVSLTNSFSAFKADLKAKQFVSAAFDIVNIPANMTNALFNGAGFTDLSKILGRFLPLPDGVKVGLNLGGLLNVTPLENPPTDQYSGGTAFDEISVTGGTFFTENAVPGVRGGLGGAMVGMGQFLAEKLKVTPPAARTSAAVKPAAAAAALDASAAETAVADEPAAESAPAVAAPSHRKARVAAANDGGKDRAGGNSRSARSSR